MPLPVECISRVIPIKKSSSMTNLNALAEAAASSFSCSKRKRKSSDSDSFMYYTQFQAPPSPIFTESLSPSTSSPDSPKDSVQVQDHISRSVDAGGVRSERKATDDELLAAVTLLEVGKPTHHIH
jgi:hypothetical protein